MLSLFPEKQQGVDAECAAKLYNSENLREMREGIDKKQTK